jgi:hypothetical protein
MSTERDEKLTQILEPVPTVPMFVGFTGKSCPSSLEKNNK